MTEEEIARFDLVLREADRIRREVMMEEVLYATDEVAPAHVIYGLDRIKEDVLLFAA